MATRLLVIEDDPVVAETLDAYLTRAGYLVTAVRDGRHGLELAKAGGFALVVLDLMVPGLPGLDVCRAIRRQSAMPVLMLTARTAEAERVHGFEAGADDYVSKPFSPREVVCRVEALLRRSGPVGETRPAAVRYGDAEIDRWAREVRIDGTPVTLTRTEFGLLDALVRADGRALTRDELVSRVFGPDCDSTDRTVDTHVANLRRKLDPAQPQRFVATSHGVGYRWNGGGRA
jgi:DNA-binding response OmpR family regulator